jgi:hypothetical protein
MEHERDPGITAEEILRLAAEYEAKEERSRMNSAEASKQNNLVEVLGQIDLTKLEAYLLEKPQRGIPLNNPQNTLRDKSGSMQWIFRGAFDDLSQFPQAKLGNDEAYYYGGFLVLVDHSGVIAIVDDEGEAVCIKREERLPDDSCDVYAFSVSMIDNIDKWLRGAEDPLMDIYNKHYGTNGCASNTRKPKASRKRHA